MSNAELIERLNSDDVVLVLSVRTQAADALEAADKRIAELEAREKILVSANSLANIERNEWQRGEGCATKAWGEAERKLAVAREALKNGRTYLVRMALINAGMLLASGEFTTLVNDSLDEFINDHLHEVSDSESPISEFDWTRITIRKMSEALAQIGGE